MISARIDPPGPMMQDASCSETSTFIVRVFWLPPIAAAQNASKPAISSPQPPIQPAPQPPLETSKPAQPTKGSGIGGIGGIIGPLALPLPADSRKRPGKLRPAWELTAQAGNQYSPQTLATWPARMGSATSMPGRGPLKATTCSARSPPAGGIAAFSTWTCRPQSDLSCAIFAPPLPITAAAAFSGTTTLSRASPGGTPSSPPLRAPVSCRTFVRACRVAASTASCEVPEMLSSTKAVPGYAAVLRDIEVFVWVQISLAPGVFRQVASIAPRRNFMVKPVSPDGPCVASWLDSASWAFWATCCAWAAPDSADALATATASAAAAAACSATRFGGGSTTEPSPCRFIRPKEATAPFPLGP
mmetsp:Transcript_35363/g.77360  ORF Transcript_35363/g.77360 Transcript_35363/m.77360 type:complete len:359 (+) Transcript_35363:2086-3162(+)